MRVSEQFEQDMRTGFWLLVLLLALVCTAMGALAENVTVTQTQNVSITCNNQSQCVVLQGATPVFFSGSDTNTTLQVPVSFTYDRNTSTPPPVVNVTTQSVVVQNCTAPSTLDVSADDLASKLNAALTSSVTSACTSVYQGLGGDLETCRNERATYKADVDTKSLEVQRAQDECRSGVAEELANLRADLNITQTERDAAEDSVWTIGFLALIAWLITLSIVGYIIYRSVKKGAPEGMGGRAQ